MGRVLPCSIWNRVGYEFLKKTWSGSRSGLGFIKKFKTRPGYNPVTLKLQKTPIYIAITNPKSLIFSAATHASLSPSLPSLPHFNSRLPQSTPTLTHSLNLLSSNHHNYNQALLTLLSSHHDSPNQAQKTCTQVMQVQHQSMDILYLTFPSPSNRNPHYSQRIQSHQTPKQLVVEKYLL